MPPGRPVAPGGPPAAGPGALSRRTPGENGPKLRTVNRSSPSFQDSATLARPFAVAALLALAPPLAGLPPGSALAQAPQGGSGAAAAEGDPLPPDPAAAPPAPARLGDPAAPARAGGRAPAAPQTHLPGLETLPDGAWRLRFGAGSAGLPAPATAALAELGRRLAARPQGRFTVHAQASGPASDASAARRLSLARALAVKEALVAGGLPATRIDVRPMGRTEAALDAADVLPPGVQRPAAATAATAAAR